MPGSTPTLPAAPGWLRPGSADGSYLSRRAAIAGGRRGRHRCAAIARRTWLVDAGIHAAPIPRSTGLIHASIAALSRRLA